MKISVLADISSPRLNYTLEFIFGLYGLDFELCKEEVLPDGDSLLVYYGLKPNPIETHNCLFIPRSSLIESYFLTNDPDEFIPESDDQLFRWVDGNVEASFDLFGWVFFFLSRMEEYEFSGEDLDLGRFSYKRSFVDKKGWLFKAVVDRWCGELVVFLKKMAPGLRILGPERDVIPTCDLDIPYAFKGKSLFRLMGAALKSLCQARAGEFFFRSKYLFVGGQDPFDTLEELSQDAGKFRKKLKCFVLFPYTVEDYRDKSGQAVKNLGGSFFIKWANSIDWGMHPSISAGDKKSRIRAEKLGLEGLIDCSITSSRQHFLRLTLPMTYRALIDAGIREDYSMGFHDSPGFRAGTSRPFYWYDLEKEKATSLKVFPLLLMDGSLKHYLKADPVKAIEKIDVLIEECAITNGIFSYLWHNSSISVIDGWDRYIPVYSHLITKCTEFMKQSK
ncbi:MAG: hypothetical protein EA409_07990 [Saprospirales bacterium]|nr:MAG: hypothetical protein EA409_07990 [Saprospirales bacterium]